MLYAIFKFCFDLFSIEWGHQTTVRRTLSRGFGGGRTIPQRLPRPPFSFVPSTARFLFGGTKRKCGVGTVGSGQCHALTDRGQYAPSTRNEYLLYASVFSVGPCGAVLSLVGKYPKDGKRGVSNPPSCNSPQRLLMRRRARYAMHFGTPCAMNRKNHNYFFSAAWVTSSTVSGCTHLPKTRDSMPGIYPRSS